MARFIPCLGALAIAALLVAGPWCYLQTYERHYRAFHVVQDGVLYRSAQLDLAGLQSVVREYGIRTVVNLRDGATRSDLDEERWAGTHGVKHVRLIPLSWWPTPDGGPCPAEANVEAFRQIMRDPANHPVLIHCFGGIHRTGTFVGVYRMDFQGWSCLEAMNEMRALGYSVLDEHKDILAYFYHHHAP